MGSLHDKRRKPGRAAEPVQVYLDAPDRQRLDRLTAHLGTTKSGVLREALHALENQLTDTAAHPALRIIGIAASDAAGADPYDVAREHDRFLADVEDARNTPTPKRKRAR